MKNCFSLGYEAKNWKSWFFVVVHKKESWLTLSFASTSKWPMRFLRMVLGHRFSGSIGGADEEADAAAATTVAFTSVSILLKRSVRIPFWNAISDLDTVQFRNLRKGWNLIVILSNCIANRILHTEKSLDVHRLRKIPLLQSWYALWLQKFTEELFMKTLLLSIGLDRLADTM